MNSKMKQNMILIAFGVFLYAALMNYSDIIAFSKGLFGIFLPIISGLIIAFVLNVPMSGFENLYRRLFQKAKRKPSDGMISTLSLLSTIGCIILIIILICTMIIPEIVSSVRSIYTIIAVKSPEWIAKLGQFGVDTTWIDQQLSGIDFENLFKNVLTGAGSLLNSAVGIASSTINVFVTCGFALVIAIYVLLGRKTLARQCKMLLYAHTKKKVAERVCYVANLINDTYSKFLSGQCIEAIILGFMIFIAFWIFKIPYASLIALLTGVLSFIPYIGAFCACFIGVLLVLLVNPVQALISFVVYQVVQFIENQFIYPNVVGGSVGLAPLWTLVAVLIGGDLFGVIGMIFFIPLTAVVYQLLKEYTHKRLKNKGEKFH
ncbi:MAG: AI-2E family transporter [Lachnospiraceae bacterium]|nr:AI-2E family transporter [Lachnospiraceae bacterium]